MSTLTVENIQGTLATSNVVTISSGHTLALTSLSTGSNTSVKLGMPLIKNNTLYNFTGNIAFSTCNTTGYSGPPKANAISSYSSLPFASTWLNDINLFNVVAGVQFFKVPKDGNYIIVCAGARSGSSTYGGLGLSIQTSYYLEAGEMLRIVVGQQGLGNAGNSGGGGGASAVAVDRYGVWVPIVIAGGGAGISSNSPQSTNTNRNARTPTNSTRGPVGGLGSKYDAAYSTNPSIGHYWPAGGGGGWATDGDTGMINASVASYRAGGSALSTMVPLGGVNWDTGWHGGFGGGASTGRNGGAAGGGGGWDGGNATYSGVSATSDDTTLLGGGSYAENSWTSLGSVTGGGYVFLIL